MNDFIRLVVSPLGVVCVSPPTPCVRVVPSSLLGDGEREGVEGAEPIHDLRFSLREKLLVTEARGVCVYGVVAAVETVFVDSVLVL